ncbi:MAG: hypothetical protein R3B49_09260 [Phycisphaerales bacterium]
MIGSYTPIDVVYGIEVRGSIAYLAGRYAGLEIVDISNPALPVLISSIELGGARRTYR